jgi:glycoside hydrolase-like protein
MGRVGKRTVLSAVASSAVIALPCAALASSSGPQAVGNTSGTRTVKTAAVPDRTISYHGYQMRVPGSWPVYRLADDPTRCVLFNRHAVYLGRPGTNQRCPAHAFGKTEAVLIQPMGSPGRLPAGTVMERGRRAGGWSAAPLAAQNANAHAMRLALPAAGVLVTATYDKDPALVEGMLNDARVTPAAAPAHRAGRHPSQHGSGRPRAARHGTARNGPASHGASRYQDSRQRAAGNDPSGATASILTGELGGGRGFDTCTVPSVATMTKWLTSPYRVAGTYLGGENWACDYGNFSASWVKRVAAEGWRFIPLWVGPQAPCSYASGVSVINPSRARAEGGSEAASAVAAARRFGYGTGTPIYFDMEAYNNTDAGCKHAVLSFLDGWTRGLHTANYLSGVYSSAASGIADLASEAGNRGFASPNDIWFADWNGKPVLTDPFVPNQVWANHERLHQYKGPQTQTWGGVSVNIDSDVVDGEVAGLRSTAGSTAEFVLARPGITAVYPGTAVKVQLAIGGTSQTPSAGSRVRWQIHAPAGLTISPDHGKVSVLPRKQKTVTLTVTASSWAVPKRHDLAVTATADGQQLVESYELVSVVQPHHSLPTPVPVRLYAADNASMALAVQVAHRLALRGGDVTGSFRQAWTDVAGGHDLVFAVGEAALHGLYTNPCGWSNPAGTGPGHTPFSVVDATLQRPPGANIFENATASSSADTGQLAAEVTHYSLTGTLPNGGTPLPGPAIPTNDCKGQPNVRVP